MYERQSIYLYFDEAIHCKSDRSIAYSALYACKPYLFVGLWHQNVDALYLHNVIDVHACAL